ncbi:hypothetical protein [Metabacillus idriensis]|nr:hypothetical protein [Metabacillus idriensis]
MFSTLTITIAEILILLIILSFSIVCMGICEWLVFRKQIYPIKRVFKDGDISMDAIEKAFRQIHRFPILTVYRIFGPHLFGLSVPAIMLTYLFISGGFVNLPLY